MKLLLLSPLPPPFGGISSWTVSLLDFFKSQPNDIDLIHQNTAIKKRDITSNGTLIRIYYGIIESVRIIYEFKGILRKNSPGLIHITSSASFSLLKDYFLLRIARRKNIPVIYHWRFGRIPDLYLKNNLEWKALCRIVRGSSLSILVDKNSYSTLLKSGFTNITCIPNPIGIEIQQKSSKIAGFNRSRRPGRLLFAGHVIRQKGVLELVQACAQLAEVKELILVGPFDEQIKKQLMDLAGIRDNGVWMHLPGNSEREHVLEYMAESPVLVLPSYSEGFPNVIIEAMAMGCAIIATHVGAIPEIISSNSDCPAGICIPPQDVESLKCAIQDLLSHEDKILAMGKSGMERVLSYYSIQNVFEKYVVVWNEIYTNNSLSS